MTPVQYTGGSKGIHNDMCGQICIRAQPVNNGWTRTGVTKKDGRKL